MRNRFTLIKLLTVIILIDILALMATYPYFGIQIKNQTTSLIEDCKAFRTELDSMFKAAHNPSPPILKKIVDWNGDGVLDSNDTTPSGTTTADIVNHVTSSSYQFKSKNLYSSGNAFDEGLIQIIPGERKVTIKRYSKKGIQVYSVTSIIN